MRISLLVVAALALVGFLWVAVFVPQRTEAQEREAAQALLAGADAAKQQISAAAEKSGKLAGAGKEVKVAPKSDGSLGDMQWIVSDDGSIRGWNKSNALEIAMTPSLAAGKVSWNCKGFPARAMPASCSSR
jgi:hypothetical protein